jgi:3',5'-cyclic AMP phosphodiesterase CpdA
VGARILHVSDLHVGAQAEDPAVEQALRSFAERERPELVVASGDLSHRAKRDQHERAASLLRGLGFPVLAVPGNHDIPWSPSRLTHPFAEFDRAWESREPVFRSRLLHVVGINSVRPLRQQSGAVGRAALERATAALWEAATGAFRVAVLHHQLLGAPWRTRKRPVAHRDRVLGALADAGAELIVSGHAHQAAVAERHEFEVVGGAARSVVLSTGPGLGRPRPKRVGEARGFHVYEADARSVGIRTYVWLDGDWSLTAVRRFARGSAAGTDRGARDDGAGYASP